jgi:hypothetical protein
MITRRVIILVLAVFLHNLSHAQLPEKLTSMMWGLDDTLYTQAKLPAMWANESAVILYQEFYNEYTREGGSIFSPQLKFVEAYHRKVKLLDAASVEQFSEFSFNEKFTSTRGERQTVGEMLVGFKLIKPNGQQQIIDLTKAVTIRNETNDIYKKIAIPDLQIGDIIDYYYCSVERFTVSGEYIFPPVVSTLSSVYPVVHEKIHFRVATDFYINFRTVNNTPEFKATPDQDAQRYTLTVSNIAKQQLPMWAYRFRALQAIKFQVIYTQSRNKNILAFISTTGKAKTSISPTDAVKFVYDRLELTNKEHKSILSKITQFANTQTTNNDPLKKTIQAYYALKHYTFNNKLEEDFLKRSTDAGLSNLDFIRIMHQYLSSQNIPHDILITTPREISDIGDLLLYQELALLIRLNIQNQYTYIANFSQYTHFAEIPQELQGNRAFVLNPAQPDSPVATHIIPPSTNLQNQLITNITVNFNPQNLQQLNIQRHHTYKGLLKERVQNRLVTVFDYINTEHAQYGSQNYAERTGALLKKKDREIIETRINETISTVQTNKPGMVQYLIEDDLNTQIDTLLDYNIIQNGMAFAAPDLIYTDQFLCSSLVKPANDNLILQIGMLIGNQVNIPDNELQRQTDIDIYMPYARAYYNTLTINIPTGYTLQGTEKLNTQTINPTGGFITKATLTQNQLTLTTQKYYLHNFEKANKWQYLTDFIQAAHQFNQTKILLKKQ